MGIAAIVERELRQTVRRQKLFRVRCGAAFAAVVVGMAVLLSHFVGGGGGSSMGRNAFQAMVLLSFGLNLLGGPVLGADTVSQEKREGTLGLLMLTRRLQGRPVVWVRRLSLIRRHQRDGGERFIARMLQVLARSMEAGELPALVGAEPLAAEPSPDAADD